MAKPATSATTAKPGPAAAAAKPAEQKTAGTDVAVRSTTQQFIDDVFAADRTQQVIDSLGDSISFPKFRASVATAIMNNPDLLQCQPPLVFREVARVAALGLVFDHHLGEAYLIAGYNRDTRKKDKPQCRVGYRGLMKLAKNESDLMIYAHEVREKDEFECILGLEKLLVHKPKVFGERGPVIGYYAVAKWHNGDTDFEPMSNAEVLAIRDRTETWKAFVDKKITFGGPWQTDEIEMGKKTVIRRLTKRLSLGPKVQAAVKIEDDAEGVIPTSVTHAPRQQAAAGALDRFAGQPAARARGPITDVPVDGLPGPGDEGKPAVEQQQQDGPYTEPEDGDGALAEQQQQEHPAEEQKVVRSHADLLALAPLMPEATAKAAKEGKVNDAWKWLNMELPKLDIEVRQALVDEHRALLWTLIEKSDGYKKAVLGFLTAQDVTLKEKEPS